MVPFINAGCVTTLAAARESLGSVSLVAGGATLVILRNCAVTGPKAPDASFARTNTRCLPSDSVLVLSVPVSASVGELKAPSLACSGKATAPGDHGGTSM